MARKTTKTRSDKGCEHKTYAYSKNKVAQIVAGLADSTDYNERHAQNPDDEKCRLAEHVGALFRHDYAEKKSAMTPELRIEAMDAIASTILSQAKMIDRLQKRLEKITDISLMDDEYDSEEDK